MLLLDYYDGPVSGIITCPGCDRRYAFDMLDWTDDRRYRLFMLYDVGLAGYERFKRIIERGSDDGGETASANYEQLKAVIHEKTMPDGLIVWDNAEDLVFTKVPVPSEERVGALIPWFENSPTSDWFDLLEIALPTPDSE